MLALNILAIYWLAAGLTTHYIVGNSWYHECGLSSDEGLLLSIIGGAVILPLAIYDYCHLQFEKTKNGGLSDD